MRGVEPLSQCKALDVGELDFIGAQALRTACAQQRCVQESKDAHGAV